MSSADEAGPALPAAAAPPPPLRQRHDGFTPKKQRRFFRTLRKTGCIADACRKAGISRETARRHRNKWPAFERRVQEALAIASTELEAIAYQRATVGAEEKVYRDGRLAYVRVKPSDAMLRLLLQGANPRKYGRTANERQASAATRRRLKDELRPELLKEFMGGRTHEELVDDAFNKMERVLEGHRNAQRAQGFRDAPEDYPDEGGLKLIAPGWALIREGERGG